MNIQIILKRIFQIPEMTFSLFKPSRSYYYFYFDDNRFLLARYSILEQFCLFRNYNFSASKILKAILENEKFFTRLNDLYKILHERNYL